MLVVVSYSPIASYKRISLEDFRALYVFAPLLLDFWQTAPHDRNRFHRESFPTRRYLFFVVLELCHLEPLKRDFLNVLIRIFLLYHFENCSQLCLLSHCQFLVGVGCSWPHPSLDLLHKRMWYEAFPNYGRAKNVNTFDPRGAFVHASLSPHCARNGDKCGREGAKIRKRARSICCWTGMYYRWRSETRMDFKLGA